MIKKILTILLISFGFIFGANAQRNYDTVITDGRGQPANVGIFEPAIYSSLTTADSVGMLVFFVGAGEATTDSTKIRLNGPMQYLSQGWDGSIVRYGRTYRLLIVTIQISSPFPQPLWITPIFNALKGRYRIKFNSVVFTGISAGGYASNEFVCYQPTAGDFSYGKRVVGVVNVEGVKPDDTYGAEPAYPTKFNQYATNGGSEIGFEQFRNDGRDINTIVTTMNAARAGSAIYIPTDYTTGGTLGGHGGWNHEFGGFLSSANGGDNTNQIPNKYLLGSDSLTIYQWAVGKMDTAKIFFSGINPTAHAGGNYNVTRENGYNVTLDGSTSSGLNLKYSWSLLPYYLANDKVTHQTFTGAEPRFGAIKGPLKAKAAFIQGGLFGQDSIHIYKAVLTVTDSVSGNFSIDTATINLRYGARFPPQSTAGSWHFANSSDVLNIPGCSLGDIVIDGGGTNGVLGKNTDIDIRPSFSNTFFTTGSTHRIWLKAGVYRRISMQWDTVGSVQGPLQPPAGMNDTLTNYGGQVEVGSFYISNTRKLVVTGKYDPVNHTGDINFRGHDAGYAYSNEKYGIYVNNMFQSTQQLNFQYDGLSTDSCEVAYVASGYGGFTGFTIKPELGTHPTITWHNMYIHDCIAFMVHGEGFYLGSANSDPVMTFQNLLFTNNISTFTGNKLFKTVQLYSNNLVTRNVGVYGAINYRSPFETNVSNGHEFFFRNGGNIISSNLIDGAAEQLMNALTGKLNTTVGSNLIKNCAFLHSTGFIGSFGAQLDSAFTTNLDSNYFGINKPYLDSNAYSGSPNGINTNETVRYLPSGSLPVGATRSTYNFTHTIYDSTKQILADGDATINISGTTLVSLLPMPQYVNSGFSAFGTTYPEQWVDSIFHTWGDEFNEGPPTRQPNPTHYKVGDVVLWWGQFYQSNVNNNFSVPGLDANWSIITFSNGGTKPPMDYRLQNTDTYARRNIGLLEQGVPSGCPDCLFYHANKFHLSTP